MGPKTDQKWPKFFGPSAFAPFAHAQARLCCLWIQVRPWKEANHSWSICLEPEKVLGTNFYRKIVTSSIGNNDNRSYLIDRYNGQKKFVCLWACNYQGQLCIDRPKWFFALGSNMIRAEPVANIISKRENYMSDE